MSTDPSTSSDPSPSSALLNTDGSFSENWHSALGEEFTAHAAQLGTFKNVAGLAKSYLHLRSSGPSYPGEESTEDDIARYHALAKVPTDATAEGYGIEIPEHATEEDRALYDRMAAIAHKHHLSGPGFAALVEEYTSLQDEHIQAHLDRQAADQRAAQDTLIREWRGDFEANASKARHCTETLAHAAGIASDDPSIQQLANHPTFAKMMLQVARMTSEDGLRAPGGNAQFQSPRQQAEDIMSGRDPVWSDRYRHGDREAMRHVSTLLEESVR